MVWKNTIQEVYLDQFMCHFTNRFVKCPAA